MTRSTNQYIYIFHLCAPSDWKTQEKQGAALVLQEPVKPHAEEKGKLVYFSPHESIYSTDCVFNDKLFCL